MRKHSTVFFLSSLLVTFVIGFASCSDSTPLVRKDAAGDMRTNDSQVADGSAIDGARADAPRGDGARADAAAADRGGKVDGPIATADSKVGDAAARDATQVDLGPAAVNRVLFTENAQAEAYTLAEISSDGTGYHQVAGFLPDIALCGLDRAGVNGPLTLSHSEAMHSSFYVGEDHVRLPNGLGRINRTLAKLGGTSIFSLVHFRPDGTVRVILEQGAGRFCTSDEMIQVSSDGALVATAADDKAVKLIRLDGPSFPNTTSPVLDVTPVGVTVGEVFDESLTFTKDGLYFVLQDSTSATRLFRAPKDGSAKASEVVLPTLDGTVPWISDRQLAVSASGSHVALVAQKRNNGDQRGIFVIDDKNPPTAKLVSTTALKYDFVGDQFMIASEFEPMVALSPSGKQVAFVEAGGVLRVLEVAGAAAAAVPSQSFDQAVNRFGALYFADDDNLLFLAGTVASTFGTTVQAAGLYRYSASAKQTSAVYGAATTTAPFTGGNLFFNGAAVLDGKRIHYVVGKYKNLVSGNDNTHIVSVDLTSFVPKAVLAPETYNLEIKLRTPMTELVGQPGSSKAWFVAWPKGTPADENVYVFDQAAGSTAIALTDTTGATRIDGLLPSPDGKRVAYLQGTGCNARLYVTDATAKVAPRPLTAAACHAPTFMWTTDAQYLVYAAGATESAKDLFVAPIFGATPRKLRSVQKYVQLVGVGK